MNRYSKVRLKTFNLYKKIDGLATKYTKHKSLKAVVDRVIKPHIEGLILNGIPEQELKTILLDCHGEIEEIADEIKLAKEIKTQGKLNDGRMKDFVESIPQFKEALELIPDV